MNFPTFAKIRAERAVREMRGLVLPFRPRTSKQEIAVENTKAATWGELWIHLFDLWEDICLDMIPKTWEHVEFVEADHNARLIREYLRRLEMGEFHTFGGITVLIPSGFTTSGWRRETPADEEKDPADAQT